MQQWVAEHTGVEAFVEPKTTVTEVTVVLVAADGEWTRRRAGGDAGARRLSERLQIPVYDVQKVGYPQRMRDYDARRRIERERAAREELEADRSSGPRCAMHGHDHRAVRRQRRRRSHRGLREGNPDGPTLVLVHGWPDSHVLWDGVVPLLADRFRIIRYDNRGVGKSSVPKPVSAYTMARFADDFAAVIDARRARRAGACAGPRLGVGGGVGVPGAARRQRPGRVVHVGVRPGADQLAATSSTASSARTGRVRFVPGARPGCCG